MSEMSNILDKSRTRNNSQMHDYIAKAVSPPVVIPMFHQTVPCSNSHFTNVTHQGRTQEITAISPALTSSTRLFIPHRLVALIEMRGALEPRPAMRR